MSEREVPSPAVGWHGANGRVYRRKIDCYYAIAKKLVVTKYPTWLHNEYEFDQHWRFDFETIDAAHTRAERAMQLFFKHDNFDSRKWKSFIQRVAKFLAFVDRQHGIRAELIHASEKRLHDEFSYAERQAQEWMERARAIETLRTTRRP